MVQRRLEGAAKRPNSKNTELRFFKHTDMKQIILNDRTAFTFKDPRDWSLPKGCIYRIAGGTRGMATYTKFENMPAHLQNFNGSGTPYALWTDEIIDNSADFIKRNECEAWLMLNINDKKEDQFDLIDRYAQRGVTITRVCIGNEIYLRKFRLGDISKLGVAKRITFGDYVSICQEWIPELKSRFSGMKVNVVTPLTKGMNARTQWFNNLNNLIAQHPGFADGFDVHIYIGTEDPTAEELKVQYEDLIELEDLKLPIHVTEGNSEDSDITSFGRKAAKRFLEITHRLLSQRRDSSITGWHVLYSRHGAKEDLFTDAGPTPLMSVIEEFLSEAQETDEPVLVDVSRNIRFYGRQLLRFSDKTWEWTPWLWFWQQVVLDRDKGKTRAELGETVKALTKENH